MDNPDFNPDLDANPDHNLGEKPAAIVLAAGASSRMGDNKMLKLWRGKPLLCYAVAAAMDARAAGLLSFVAVVCGRDFLETSKLAADADVVVCNDDYRRGIASSLIKGLDSLPHGCRAVVVLLGDMPHVCRGDIAVVVDEWRRCGCDIVVAEYAGGRGHPVLLSARVFDKVRRLSGDNGARVLFDSCNVRFVNAGRGVVVDMDTPEQMKDESEGGGFVNG